MTETEFLLGANQYGKAENRVVRFVRDSPRHEIFDLNVSTSLIGDFADAHLSGDQAKILPTDTQKQTAYVFAKGLGAQYPSPVDYAKALAEHFVDTVPWVTRARVDVEVYSWERIPTSADGHDHSWTRTGHVRLISAVVEEAAGQRHAGADHVTPAAGLRSWVVDGIGDLVLLKSTGSQFHGFLRDEYTVLEETADRVLATSLTARWRYEPTARGFPWDQSYDRVRSSVISQFAEVESLALQQTLYEMGKAALTAEPALAEIRLVAPNKHHFLYDLQRFGIDNAGEVFHADDRPYGLIQASVLRPGAADPGPAWTAGLL